jgi:hypothetical protein
MEEAFTSLPDLSVKFWLELELMFGRRPWTPSFASFKNGLLFTITTSTMLFCLSSFQVWRLGEHFRTMIFLVGFGFIKTNQKIDPKYRPKPFQGFWLSQFFVQFTMINQCGT